MPFCSSQSATRIVSVIGEAVDDAGAGKLRDGLDEPRHALGGVRLRRPLEREALAVERSAMDVDVAAELRDDVVDHAVVGGRGGAQHRDPGWQRVETRAMRR
jgi:hypothetical protein